MLETLARNRRNAANRREKQRTVDPQAGQGSSNRRGARHLPQTEFSKVLILSFLRHERPPPADEHSFWSRSARRLSIARDGCARLSPIRFRYHRGTIFFF